MTALLTARGHFVARNPAAAKQRPGGGSWEEATNRQQRKIVKVYDGWAANLKRELRTRYDRGADIPELSSFLDNEIRRLSGRLVEITSKGVEGAVKISAKSRADRPEVRAVKEKLLTENKALVEENLVPRIHERLTLALATGALALPFGMNNAVNATRSMPAGYAGGYWVAIFETQKAVGEGRERERLAAGLSIEPVRWILDPMAEHCQPSAGFFGCPELAGEYPGGWATLRTVPAGQVTCRGNCRCHIEVFRDGEWRRGVYDD